VKYDLLRPPEGVSKTRINLSNRAAFIVAACCALALLPSVCPAEPVLLLADPQSSQPQDLTLAKDRWTGHAGYVFGYKKLESKWSPAQNQVEFGVLDVDVLPPRWPVSLAAQLLASATDSIPDSANTFGDWSGVYELNLGLRKVFNQGKTWEPFVGGGFSIMGSAISTQMFDSYYQHNGTTGFGYWISGGIYWNFTRHWHVGLEAEYSSAELHLFDAKLDAGGLHALVMVGYHW
jgi:hypothetical protein